jgi:hypothetical protein
MIEIIVTVCALTQPDQCQEQHLQFAWGGSLRQCMMAAQPYIAEWIGEHPNWAVKKYRCEFPHTRDKADARATARPA